MAGESRLQVERGYCRGLHSYAYLTGIGKRDKPLSSLSAALGAKCIGSDTSYKGGLSLFFGFGDPHEANIIRCMREGLPFFHMDHAYFKRGYEHGNFRVNFGHFHQTRLLDVPGDRSTLARKRLEEWKKGRDVVVIVPSERICMVLSALRGSYLGPKDWCRQTEAELKKHTDRPIIRKEKGGSLLDNLRTAHAVVSLSSVAEVEAAVRGVPVFTSWNSPASQVSEKDLSKIETPTYPDREAWLRTLSYSQFNLQEMSNGTTASILKELYELFDPPDIR